MKVKNEKGKCIKPISINLQKDRNGCIWAHEYVVSFTYRLSVLRSCQLNFALYCNSLKFCRSHVCAPIDMTIFFLHLYDLFPTLFHKTLTLFYLFIYIVLFLVVLNMLIDTIKCLASIFYNTHKSCLALYRGVYNFYDLFFLSKLWFLRNLFLVHYVRDISKIYIFRTF